AEDLQGDLVFDVANTGRTSLRDVSATVTLPPTDGGEPFPPAVEVTAAAPWDCTRSGATLDCTLTRLARGDSVPLALTLDARDLDPRSATPLRDLRVDGAVSLVVDRRGTQDTLTSDAGLVLRSAPPAYTVDIVES